jgi:predicted ArsR family transcriptional regulator
MDELEAVGDPELRAALLFARGEARPVTADELATAQGVHRNVARGRLERLAEAGLLAPGFERRSGRTGPGAGRPAKTYSVEPALESIEFPGRRYEALFGLLLEALPVSGRAKRLHEVGVAFGEDLADAAGLEPSASPQRALTQMCSAVRSLGYQASVVSVDDTTAVIATPTCPLRPLVRAQPHAAEIDRGMWAGLASRALVGAEVGLVRCETRDCLVDHASCEVRLTLLGSDGSALNPLF